MVLALTKHTGTSSQLFSEINSIFDVHKEDKLDKLDDTISTPYNTRSSSHKKPTKSLDLGGNWSDGTPAIVDSSTSEWFNHSNNNLGGKVITMMS